MDTTENSTEKNAINGTADKNSRKALLISLAVLAALVVLALVVVQHTAGKSYTKPVGVTVAGYKQFNIHLNHGDLDSGPKTLTVKKGDKVYIKITTSNQPEGDVRIVGYNQQTSIEGDSIAGLEFVADKTGTFKIESRTEADHEDSSASVSTKEAVAEFKHIATFVVK